MSFVARTDYFEAHQLFIEDGYKATVLRVCKNN
jgi:hypothetical protein